MRRKLSSCEHATALAVTPPGTVAVMESQVMKMKASPWLARCGVVSVIVAGFVFSTMAKADELQKASTGGEEIVLADPVNSERVTHVRY